MRYLKWMVFAVLVFALGGCTGLTPENLAATEQQFRQLLAQGVISQEQFDAMMLLLRDAAAKSKNEWIHDAAQTALTLALGYFGVRTWRGTPNNRTGAPPTPKTA